METNTIRMYRTYRRLVMRIRWAKYRRSYEGETLRVGDQLIFRRGGGFWKWAPRCKVGIKYLSKGRLVVSKKVTSESINLTLDWNKFWKYARRFEWCRTDLPLGAAILLAKITQVQAIRCMAASSDATVVGGRFDASRPACHILVIKIKISLRVGFSFPFGF